MFTRREFLGKTLTGVAGGAALAARDLRGAGRLAWPGPIGLEIYTVRNQFAKDPEGTLKRVAAVGYKEVEIGPGAKPAAFVQELRTAGLTAPSGYFDMPKTLNDWKKAVDDAHGYGLRYIVVGDNPSLDADAWKRRASFFNQCGKVALDAGI